MTAIPQLTTNLPGRESEADKAIAAVVRTLIDAVNALAGPPPVVTPPPPVSRVTLVPSTLALTVGASTAVKYELFTATGANAAPPERVITWSSDDPAIADWSPSSLGTVIAKQAGTVKLWMRSEGESATVIAVVSDAVVVTPPPPPPPPPPVTGPVPATDLALVNRIVGPVPTLALVQSVPGYLAQFGVYGDKLWTMYGIGGTNELEISSGNYYDLAGTYYTCWVITGIAEYRVRADKLAVAYRDQYVEVATGGYRVAPHNSFVDGLAIHALLAPNATDAARSKKAVGRLADYLYWMIFAGTPDERVLAYAIRALLAAHELNAPSDGVVEGGGIPAAGDWPTALRRTLALAFTRQRPDGGFMGGPCGGLDHPFTAGLLMDNLTRYYETFEADPRIEECVRRAAEHYYANDWIAASNAFKYVGATCEGEGGPNPAPILNGLIVPGYAWLFKRTGNTAWREKARLMLKGSVDSGEAVNGVKMFAQQFSTTPRAIAYAGPFVTP